MFPPLFLDNNHVPFFSAGVKASTPLFFPSLEKPWSPRKLPSDNIHGWITSSLGERSPIDKLPFSKKVIVLFFSPRDEKSRVFNCGGFFPCDLSRQLFFSVENLSLVAPFFQLRFRKMTQFLPFLFSLSRYISIFPSVVCAFFLFGIVDLRQFPLAAAC